MRQSAFHTRLHLLLLIAGLALTPCSSRASNEDDAGASESSPYIHQELMLLEGDCFLLADTKGSGEQLLVSCDLDSRDDDWHLVRAFDSEHFNYKLQWAKPFHGGRGGLAGTCDRNGNGCDELILWEVRDGTFDIYGVELQHWTREVRAHEVWRLELDRALFGTSIEELRCSANGIQLGKGGPLVLNLRDYACASGGGLLYLPHEGRPFFEPASGEIVDLRADAARKNLFMTSIATTAGEEVLGEEGGQSYWIVRDREGRALLHRAAGGPYSQAGTLPLERRGRETLVAAFLCDNLHRPDQLRVFSLRGELIRAREFESPLCAVIATDLDHNEEDELLAGFMDGSLVLFDANLERIATWRHGARVKPLVVGSLFDDGLYQVLLNVGGRPGLFDEKMNLLLRFDVAPGMDARHFSAATRGWALPGGQARLLLPGTRGGARVLELGENPNFKAASRLPLSFWLLLSLLAAFLTLAYLLLRRQSPPAKSEELGAEKDDYSYWLSFYLLLRDFRHSRVCRQDLERLLLHLNNADELVAGRLYESLISSLKAFRQVILPQFLRLASAADERLWNEAQRSVFEADCALCGEQTDQLLAGGNPTLLKDLLFKCALERCRDKVKDFKITAENMLACPLGDGLSDGLAAVRRRLPSVENLHLGCARIGLDERLVMLRPDFLALMDALLVLHAARLRNTKHPTLTISFERLDQRLVVSSKDNASALDGTAIPPAGLCALLAVYDLPAAMHGAHGIELTLDLVEHGSPADTRTVGFMRVEVSA